MDYPLSKMYDLSAVYMTCLIWNLFFQSYGVAAVEFMGGTVELRGPTVNNGGLVNSGRALSISRNLLMNSRGKLLNFGYSQF